MSRRVGIVLLVGALITAAARAGLAPPRSCAYLTEVDQVNRLAWIALDPALPGEPAVGVARCIRLPAVPHVAEVAVTVLDAYQGRGLGTLLLGVLSQAAAAQGIQRYRAYVQEDNEAVLRIFRDLGTQVGCVHCRVYQLDIPVPETPETLPNTPTGWVFKAVASRHPAFMKSSGSVR